MTGMLKPKEHKFADSNIANLGTAVEHNVKKAAAQGEKAWDGIGQKVGMNIWRIEKFKVVPVPEKEYGSFHTMDSYILLNTYKKDPNKPALSYDLHFWLGASTSQDEAGTAAYKTVELDDVLSGKAAQHRECEHYESEMFLSYWKNKGGMRILEGGCGTGFHHVTATQYKPRLMWLKGRKNVRCVEVPMSGKSLNSGDVFVLDAGLTAYQWNGAKSTALERARAAQLLEALETEREKLTKIVYEEGDKDAKPFWDLLGGEVKPAPDSPGDADWEKKANTEKFLFRLTEDPKTKKLSFTLVAAEGGKQDQKVEKKVTKALLKSEDVYILDIASEVFSWIGAKATVREKKLALQYCLDYSAHAKRPAWTPVTRVSEGQENKHFLDAFSK